MMASESSADPAVASSPPVSSSPEAPVGPAFEPRTALTLVAVASAVLLLRYTADVMIPLALAGLLFYALDSPVDAMQRWKVPRWIAALLAILFVLAGVATLGYTLQDDILATIDDLPRGARKLSTLLRQPAATPGPLQAVQEAADALQTPPTAKKPGGVIPVEVQTPGFQASAFAWAHAGGLLSAFNQALMVLFLTYFMLLSDQLFKRKLVELGPTLSRKKITLKILEDIATQIERFFRVQIGTSVLVGLVTWLALWALGLHQAALWGLLAGVLNSIPYYGPLLVSGGLALIGFMQFGTFSMTAAVAGVSLVITTLEGAVLTPALMGKVAQMNHVTVFVGLLFWSWAWGLWGLLLAVPLMMVIKAVCDGVEEFQPLGRLMGE